MNTKAKLVHFTDRFYASPKTLKQIFRDIQHPDLNEHRIPEPDLQQFLSTFYFLKKYPTKESQAGFAALSGKHSLLIAWKYVKAIQALKEKKIKWIFDEMPGEVDEFFFLSVDGVHCHIFEPRFMPSSSWYSHKFNKAGLSYEIAVSIYHDKICWVNGPFPAGQNDLKIFSKPNGLLSKIPENKRVIGDEGYVGAPPGKVATRNEFDNQDVKDLKKRAKARQETVNQKLKSFQVLSGTFRTTGEQRFAKHQSAFEACLVIIQYELDNGSRKLMKV